MITDLNKLDNDVQKFRERQLDKHLSEPPVEDTECCCVCRHYFNKDDMLREDGLWICEDCYKEVGSNTK